MKLFEGKDFTARDWATNKCSRLKSNSSFLSPAQLCTHLAPRQPFSRQAGRKHPWMPRLPASGSPCEKDRERALSFAEASAPSSCSGPRCSWPRAPPLQCSRGPTTLRWQRPHWQGNRRGAQPAGPAPRLPSGWPGPPRQGCWTDARLSPAHVGSCGKRAGALRPDGKVRRAFVSKPDCFRGRWGSALSWGAPPAPGNAPRREGAPHVAAWRLLQGELLLGSPAVGRRQRCKQVGVAPSRQHA